MMDCNDAYLEEVQRKVAGRPAPYGTYLNVGEKVDDPEWYAGEAEPIGIIECDTSRIRFGASAPFSQTKLLQS